MQSVCMVVASVAFLSSALIACSMSPPSVTSPHLLHWPDRSMFRQLVRCGTNCRHILAEGGLSVCCWLYGSGATQEASFAIVVGMTSWSAVTSAVQLLQIPEVHLVPHFSACNFLPFLCIFLYLSYLSHFYDSKLRPDDRATLLLSSRSSFITWRHSWAPRRSVVCILFASIRTKYLAQKVGHPGMLRPISMIQAPFCSSCVALQC